MSSGALLAWPSWPTCGPRRRRLEALLDFARSHVPGTRIVFATPL